MRALPHGRPRGRDGRVGDGAADSARPRGRGRRRGSGAGGDVRCSRGPCRRRVARAVRNVPVVHEACAVKVPRELPVEQAALLACGFSTGAGAALWTTPVQVGATVAVIGCGGVGLAVVQGAKLAGASRIVAVDVAAEKLELARVFGATDVVDATAGDPVGQVRDLTRGVDFAFSAVGPPEALAQAVRMCAYAGWATLVGIPPGGGRLDVDLYREVFAPKVGIAVTHGGDTIPQEDFPFLAQAALDGRVDLARFVSRTIGLDEAPDALETVGRDGIRTVVMF